MVDHLLIVTLGPVQEFIAQARRTRDLWYSSHLLSELSRAAARALDEPGVELVFPHLPSEELVACTAPLRKNGQPPLNVANKLMARVRDLDETSVRAIVVRVRAAVLEHWRGLAAQVHHRWREMIAPKTDEVWAEQIESFVEFHACWAPIKDYAQTLRKVEGELTARKALRDFSPWRKQRGGVPKSSLDGQRETILKEPNRRPAGLVKKLGISPGEQLDAVGLVKRGGGAPEQFVPITNVALAAWLEAVARDQPDRLHDLARHCKTLGLGSVQREIPCGKVFAYDASVFLPSRWRSLFEESGTPAAELDRSGRHLRWGRAHVEPIVSRSREPYPYVACLVADGDNMGDILGQLKTPSEHQEFSRTLAQFPGKARRIVEQEHLGSLVYAGGDDVLAFVPLSEALSCADALRRCFSVITNATLSVGIGVGHLHESMGSLLDLGREAEKQAKATHLLDGRARNALALIVEARGGKRRTWRAQWEKDPVARVHRDIELLACTLSTRKVHEIDALLRRLPAPKPEEDEPNPGAVEVLVGEVERILARVQAEEGTVTPDDAGLNLEPSSGYRRLREEIAQWVSRMLIAKTLSRAIVESPRDTQTREAS